MTILIYLSIAIAVLSILVIQLIIFFEYFGKDHTVLEPISKADLPVVDVVIAARDEEGNIEECLDSLINQTYPSQLTNIYVGNDASSDKTGDIINSLAVKHANIHAFDIIESMGKARGKSNVLAQLIRKGDGQYILVTDADIQLPPTWIEGMVNRAIAFEIDIVTGVTSTHPISLWHRLQQIDWLYALGMIRSISSIGIPLTSMGNNMLVSRNAYDSTGGYENLDFNIVEDYQLFHEVIKNGYSYANLWSPDVFATTKGQNSLTDLLVQRKRWLRGAVQLPWYIVLLLGIQGLYYPFIFILLFLNPEMGGNLLGLKLLFQMIYQIRMAKKLGLRFNLFHGILYEVYSFIVSVYSMIYYLIPAKLNWKGRYY